MTTARIHYVVLVLAGLIGFSYLLRFTHEGCGLAVLALVAPRALNRLLSPGRDGVDRTAVPGPDAASVPEPPQQPVVNTLGRERSMSEFEDKFNSKFGYPYVFLNEEPFSEIFKQSVGTLTQNTIEFGLIPHEHWHQPDWIDEAKARAAREQRSGIMSSMVVSSVPYRNMLRFNAGFFHRHELLQKYRYYWRVEPDVRFFCTIDDDPFLVMQDQDKKYGFTLALPEYPRTIPGLWDALKGDDGGESYNHCACASVHASPTSQDTHVPAFPSGPTSRLLTSTSGVERHTPNLHYLDAKGGFYYERWADNTVHSIAVALFARKDQMHFFDNIGYRHEPFHCPRCECDMADNFDLARYSCYRDTAAIV
ncbi:glycosyltransferase family 15 protein [Mycena vulgaris]|nr:glycosyltransferase family 15 protein [Mycena vulgaris]